MRRIISGMLAAALALGLWGAAPAQAKVYKMDPEERAAALKEKKSKRSKAKKEGKAAPGQDQGGWVEVKPGEPVAKKHKKSAKVEESAKPAGENAKKSKKGKKEAAEAQVEPRAKKGKKAAEPADEPVKKSKKGKKAVEPADEPVKKSKKSKKDAAEPVAEKKSAKAGKKAGRKNATYGDRLVGKDYSGGKISGTSTEVRRQGDDLSGYSVSRPGQEKAPERPEAGGAVEVSKPAGAEHAKPGEGRF